LLYPRNGEQLGDPIVVRAPVPTPDSLFGGTVAVSGEDLIVTEGALNSLFRVRSYRYDGAQWLATGELDTNDAGPQNGSNFGYSLWLKGSQLVGGAPRLSLPNRSSAGAAYLFERVGAQWTKTARFIADDANDGDALGTSVSMFGSSVFTGAPGNSNENGEEAGAVYVFSNDGSGWAQSQKIVADGGGPADFFGYAVATNGEHLFVGAPWAIVNGISSGAVYVFERNDESWEQTATLLPSVAIDAAEFGTTLALSGADVLIGASEGFFTTVPDTTGHVYVFSQVGGVWSESAILTPQDAEDNARFGIALAADATLAAVARARDVFASGHPLLVAVYARCECVGDLNGDRTVGLDDLAVLLTNFGAPDAMPEDGDVDGDADVDLADLTLLLAAFGTTCV